MKRTTDRRVDQYRRWFMKRLREKPDAPLLFTDEYLRPVWWFLKGNYISLDGLMRELGCGYVAMLRILDQEQIFVTRVAAGMGHYCFVERRYLPCLLAMHGTQNAKQRRQRLWNTRYWSTLKVICPKCGVKEKQWRIGKPRKNGNLPLHCGV